MLKYNKVLIYFWVCWFTLMEVNKWFRITLPAADCDLIDGVVSVSLIHPRGLRVVLSTEEEPDLSGLYHPLKRRGVVEVVVAWSWVRLRCQQGERDVSTGERGVAVKNTRGTGAWWEDIVIYITHSQSNHRQTCFEFFWSCLTFVQTHMSWTQLAQTPN